MYDRQEIHGQDEETYVRLFGKSLTDYQSPLEPNCNPELDTSELLEGDDIKILQTLVGQAQWVIQLGRFDIGVHVMMTLSSFRMSHTHEDWYARFLQP